MLNMTSKSFESNCFQDFLESLPKEIFWESFDIYQWKGFWFQPFILQSTIALSTEFVPRDDDIILASSLKVGTTWLKALCLSINNGADQENEDILTKGSPHLFVPTIESMVFVPNSDSVLSGMASPRLLHTHLPYSLLPDSMKNSGCKIVYLTRNPKDTFISFWHYFNSTKVDTCGTERPLVIGIKQQISLEKAFESFCNGTYLYGPIFDHALEYHKESSKMPQKILFMKYEELKKDPKGQLKKLASFLGKPFTEEEKVDKILWRCSLERLKNLEVNKNGVNPWNWLDNSGYFRLGVTGDSKNYLTAEMEERLDQIARTKLEASGLDLDA
nr:cytosolic sulfotransferase 5-like [Coffea arabica]